MKRGRAVEQRAVDDVGVAGDPARVGGAPPAVFVLDVEDVLERGVGADHVAAVGVQDGLGLAGGAGGVQDVERVFGVHRPRWRICRWRWAAPSGRGTSGRGPASMVTSLPGALDHDHVLHRWAALERLVHDAS